MPPDAADRSANRGDRLGGVITFFMNGGEEAARDLAGDAGGGRELEDGDGGGANHDQGGRNA